MKYRVWDINRSEYVKNILVAPDGMLYKCITSALSINSIVEINSDNYIIDPSTGLFDKNGIEIFVNDVMRCPADIWYAHTIVLDYFQKKERKAYNDYLEVVKMDYSLLDMRTNDYNGNWEVVGTIHNDELMKEVGKEE